METPVYSPKSPLASTRAPRAGFALVIALSLMAFVLLLLLSITTLVRVESQSAEISLSTLKARQNAMLGAMIAVGELQKYAGPDQRVTATAEYAFGRPVLSGLPDAGTNVAQKYWTEVWQSKRGADGSNQTEFLAYLVSHDQANPQGPVFANGNAPDDGNVWMVNHAVDPDQDGSNLDAKVQVPKVDINNSGGLDNGAYAYWVADESVKASLDLVEPALIEAIDSKQETENLFASRFIGSSGLHFADFEDDSNTEGLLSGDSGLDEISDTTLAAFSKISDWSALAMLNTSWDQDYLADKSTIHSLTPFSLSLLADSLRGGLRADLSAYISDVSPVLAQTAQPDADLASLADRDSIIDTLEWSAAGLDTSATGLPNLPAFGLIRDWANAGRDLKGFDGGTPPAARKASSTTMHLAPVVASAGLLFDLSFEVSTDAVTAAQSDQIYLLVHPRVVFWNPYDAPIAGGDYEVIITADVGDTFDDIWFRDLEDFTNRTASGALPAVNYEDIVPDRKIRLSVSLPVMQPGQNIVCTLGAKQKSSGASSTSYTLDNVVLQDNFVAFQIPGWQYDSTGWGEEMRHGARLRERPYGSQVQTYLFNTSNPVDEYRYSVVLETDTGEELFRIEDQGAVAPAGQYINVAVNERIKALPELNDLINGDLFTNVTAGSGNTNTKFSFWTGTNSRRQIGPSFSLRNVIGGNSAANFALSNASQFFGSYSFRVSEIDRPPENRRDPLDELDENQYPQVVAGVYSASVFRAFEVDVAQTNAYGSAEDSEYFVMSNSGAWGHELIYTFYSLPRGDVPLISIGSLKDVPFSRYAWHPAVPLGNSRADLRIARSELFGYFASGDNSANRHSDLSYLLNDRLFDSFFFSTINQPSGSDLSVIVSGKKNPDADVILPSSRLRFIPGEDGTYPDDGDDVRGVYAAAAHLGVLGGFNVNSVSTEAWRALLAATRDLQRYSETGLAGADSRTLIAGNRFAYENDRQVLKGGNAPEVLAGLRSLTDAEIVALADAIVAENKDRMYDTLGGPFASLGTFINRQLDTGPHGLKGSLQAAIDRTDINAHFYEYYANNGNSSSGDDFFEAGDLYTGIDVPIPEHVSGASSGTDVSRAYGLPEYLEQAELLELIAPSLTARGDTFRVRAYGETSDFGENQAQAYCELIVQRVPDFVDSGVDDPEERPYLPTSVWSAGTPDNLSEINSRFGRQFKIIDIRWLTADEI